MKLASAIRVAATQVMTRRRGTARGREGGWWVDVDKKISVERERESEREGEREDGWPSHGCMLIGLTHGMLT
eukprot:7102671-Prorocentrum_lima.AAC.1